MRPTLTALAVVSALAFRPGASLAEAPTSPAPRQTSLAFDGDVFLSVERSADFNLHDADFTIHARLRTEEGGTILSKSRAKGDWSPNGKSLFVAEGHLVYDIGWVGAVYSQRRIGDEAWHDVVLSWTHADGRVRIWIDGEPSAVARIGEDGEDGEDGEAREPPHLRPAARAPGHVVRIGFTRPDFPEDAPSVFTGEIDVLRFWQRALRADEIAALRADRRPENRLIAEWSFRGVAGSTVADATGTGHTARLERLRTVEPIVPRPRVVPRPEPVVLPKEVYTLEEVRPLLDAHCVGCHGKRRSRGELDLESALEQRPLVRNLDLWENVLHRIEHVEMPPEDEDQPSRVERAMLVRWLDREIHEFDYSQVDDPGHVPARRLTHAEYSNTLRDLFGLDVNVGEVFPRDLRATSGFDNSANSLFVQPLLLERYLSAADLAVARALPDEPATSEERHARATILCATPDASRTEEDAARTILERFLPRAFRRSVTPEELAQWRALFVALRRGEDSFEAAVKKTIAAALVSPKFLLRAEPDPSSDAPSRVGQFELASRLSYFIWASMPDAGSFLALALEERLHDPAVLEEQVERMLDDPRSGTLGSLFAAQWLGFGILGTRVRLDPIDNPWCTDTLMAAMRRETELLFAALVRDNEPISRIIDAGFTHLNEELARHYRISGVRGERMRRVALEDPRRHGLFGHASVLAVTSFPGRTSPVVRGRWILADLLGTPPPPPPPNVSEIADEIRENRRLTQREKLALHRENRRCASCHDAMDPLGLSLENFDWFGRWRERSHGRRIDAGGRLPDGTEFRGPEGLRQVILEKRRDDLVRQVTRKTLAYALGRQLEYFDEPAVRKILAALAGEEQRFRTLIHRIVTSYPFQYRKIARPETGPEGDSP